jgi:tetratricopeptide (TPR) repeat protein
MSESKRGVNAIFAVSVVLLTAAALAGMYANRNLPVIGEAPAVQAGPAAQGELPEGHPPVESGARIASMEQAIKADPANADLRTQLGNAYYDSRQYQKAIEAYAESLRLKPEDPHVETDMATSYHYLGQHDRALETFDRVLQRTPGFAQALFNKGVVLQVGKNDAAGAVAAWEELLRTNPSFPQKADLEDRIRRLKAGQR